MCNRFIIFLGLYKYYISMSLCRTIHNFNNYLVLSFLLYVTVVSLSPPHPTLLYNLDVVVSRF